MSVNNEEKTTKLVTQWNISTIGYSSDSADFEDSYMEDWLNDTSVDGFLGNLREPDKFIVTDSVWDATLDATRLGSITRPNGEATVTSTVGLLNAYEYQSASSGYITEDEHSIGYLNNGLYWWTLTPDYGSNALVRLVNNGGVCDTGISAKTYGVRPSMNLKSNVVITGGDGTKNNPFTLELAN